MTPEDARLLQELLEEQTRLRRQMGRLDGRIIELHERLGSGRREEVTPPAVVQPSVFPVGKPLSPEAVLIPPPLPPETVVERKEAILADPDPVPLPAPTLAAPFRMADAPPAGETWELQLGTVWFARIGIVVLITGLVFLGNYAWQHVVGLLGPGGKLGLLVAAGAILAGLGRWLEGRAEATRNYGRVLIAGGAATLYYSAYAAHFVRPLQVIASPLVGGALLLVLAGLFIAWADRQKSQTVAVLTIVLAYYTSAINPIGSFTLFSSVLLTAGAVWLLLRHQWDTLGWASLLGTYGSFAYWRMVNPAQATHWSTGLAFLVGYWVLFTGAGLLRSGDKMPAARRTAFLTLNNAAFFGLAAWRFLSLDSVYFAWFAIGYGAALLGTSFFARQRLGEQPAVERALLVQGLLLVTVGLIGKFTGAQLALLLAVESTLLLIAARWRHARIFEAFSLLSAGAAWVAAWLHGGSLLPSGAGAILVFNTWWLRARLPHLRERALDLRAGLFVAGAITLFVPALHVALAAKDLPAAWTVMALLGTASIYLLRTPELVYGTQIVLGVAVIQLFAEPKSSSWWQLLPPIIGALALSHWWQHQRALKMPTEFTRALQVAWALGVTLVAIAWLNDRVAGDAWMVAASGAALAMLVYGLLTRSWALAVAAQIFTVLAVASFLGRVVTAEPSRYATLAPIAALAITATIFRFGARRLPRADLASQACQLAGYVLFAVWLSEFVPGAWLPLAYVATGAVVLIATWVWGADATIVGSSFLLAGLAVFGGFSWGAASWADLLAILLGPFALGIAAHLSPAESSPAQPWLRKSVLILAVACLWLWTTRWAIAHGGSEGLTVAWSVLALVVFGTGLGMQERIYRLGGFFFLALAVGRVFLVDVWRLETLHRILSFLVLGAVLLVLGFVYNRFAEQIRRLL